MSKPIRTDGIRTVDDLMQRCVIDDLSGCWIWKGAMTGKNPAPTLWLPALGVRTTMGVAIAMLLTGKKPRKGVVWHCTCESRGCANPRHRTAGTRSSQMIAAGLVRPPLVRAKIAAGKRANSTLSEAAVSEIRASDDTLHVIAARHAISPSHAGLIRQGKMRRPMVPRAQASST